MKNQSHITHILFDLDGTLTDSGAGITKAVQYALSKFDIHVENLNDLNHFVGPPLHDSFRHHYGFSDRDIETGVDHFRDYYDEKGVFDNKPYHKVDETLAKLKEHGYALGVATAKPHETAHQVLNHFKLSGYFDHIVGADYTDNIPQKDTIIRECLGKFTENSKEKYIMIGDRKHDIIAAQKNGIQSVGVLYGYGSEEELKNAGADHIVSHHGEILEL